MLFENSLLDPPKFGLGCALRARLYEDAVDMLRRVWAAADKADRPHEAAKCALSMAVVQLARGDSVAAGKVFDEANTRVAGFIRTDEGNACAVLLDAYDAHSQDSLTAVVRRQVFDFLEAEVVRVARKVLNVDAEFAIAPAGAGGASAAAAKPVPSVWQTMAATSQPKPTPAPAPAPAELPTEKPSAAPAEEEERPEVAPAEKPKQPPVVAEEPKTPEEPDRAPETAAAATEEGEKEERPTAVPTEERPADPEDPDGLC